jgi:hypothetical protein
LNIPEFSREGRASEEASEVGQQVASTVVEGGRLMGEELEVRSEEDGSSSMLKATFGEGRMHLPLNGSAEAGAPYDVAKYCWRRYDAPAAQWVC